MRLFKLLLLSLLIIVTALFGYTTFQDRVSGVNVGPTLSCPQEVLEISVLDPQEALLSGITARDKQDGDLTDHILIQGFSRQITDSLTTVSYLVFDSDGNSASATRSVRYTDYVSPRFVVWESLVYSTNQSIALLDRMGATDCIDGDITNSIRVGAMTATADPEIYTTQLQVTNSFSDTARLTLPLVVYSATGYHPQIELSDYLVYLNQGDSFRPRDYLRSVNLPLEETGSLSDVTVSGTVDTAVPGTYMVIYRYPYEDVTALAVLTVVVE